MRGCVFGATRRRAEAVEDHGHTESCLEKVGNKTSKCVPSKAHFSIEPGTGPEIQGLLPYYCFQKGPGVHEFATDVTHVSFLYLDKIIMRIWQFDLL